MIIRNEDVKGIVVEIPEGHNHIRSTVVLKDGSELIFQEATISNLIRAFITVKTHPTNTRVRLEGKEVPDAKPGYALWQTIE